jgi:hypothetical protein
MNDAKGLSAKLLNAGHIKSSDSQRKYLCDEALTPFFLPTREGTDRLFLFAVSLSALLGIACCAASNGTMVVSGELERNTDRITNQPTTN